MATTDTQPKRLPILTFCAGHMAVDWPHGAFWVLQPPIALAMGLSPSQMGLMVALTAVGATLSLLPAGMLSDHTRRRGPVFAGTFVWVVVGYGLASLAPDFWTLTLMLAIAGMGTSAWHPLATGTLTQTMAGQRARVLGIHAMGGTLAEVFAPLLTGVLLLYLDWREGLALAVIPAAVVGIIFFQARDRLTVETASAARLGDLKEMMQQWTSKTGLALVSMISIYNMAVMSVLAMATLYIVNDLGFSVFWGGVAFSAMILAGAVFQPIMGHLSDTMGRRKIFAISLFAAAPLGFAMPFIGSPWVAIGFLIVMIGAFYGVRSVVLASAVDFAGKREGTTLGLAFTLMDGVGALGAFLGGWAGDFDLAYAFALASGFAMISGTIALGSTLAFPKIQAEPAE
ncbi:MAG: MFS transporter [Rhodospirillaceae bacterium]|nr:MFS transporter [Rhodospirillaceae bacterium]|tara:strand:- start:1451 stop:2647 length:1197 start_codon:yes stop_codon:yes gene_type:complete